MKIKLIAAISSFIIISSCGLISKSYNESMTTFGKVFLPDSCDISLINSIVMFRSDKKVFPDYSILLGFKDSQTFKCQTIYDSINIFPYGLDSTDLLVIKKLDTQNPTGSYSKYYRIIFQNDTTKTIKEFIKTSNPAKKEKKNKNSYKIEWD